MNEVRHANIENGLNPVKDDNKEDYKQVRMWEKEGKPWDYCTYLQFKR